MMVVFATMYVFGTCTGELQAQPLVGAEALAPAPPAAMWADPTGSDDSTRQQSLAYLNLEDRFSHLHVDHPSSSRACASHLNR